MNTDIDETLQLMQRLIEYRYQKALHHQLMLPLGFYGWGTWVGRWLA